MRQTQGCFMAIPWLPLRLIMKRFHEGFDYERRAYIKNQARIKEEVTMAKTDASKEILHWGGAHERGR